MSAAEHAARGTYVPSRHGPLPPGVVPARRPVLVPKAGGPAKGQPAVPPGPVAFLTAEDCPAVLTEEGRAVWAALVTQRPTDKLFGAFVAIYVEAFLAWRRATEQVNSKGDFGKVGEKPTANPFLKLRRDAEATMFRVAEFIGWQPQPFAPSGASEPPKSRLDLFLEAGRRA